MKKLIYLFIITFILVGCSQESTKKPLTKDETIKLIQKTIKNTNSITVHADNTTTVTYDKFTTKFDETLDSKYDTINQSALKVKAKSNNTKYKVKPYIYNLSKNNETIFPETNYISYRAQLADRNYLQDLQADVVNLTDTVQDVIKKDSSDIVLKDNTFSYEGKSESIQSLYEYGFHFSSMHQISLFNQITDLKVVSGKYTIDLSPTNKFMKQLDFKVTMTGKIKSKPVTIKMKQETQYKDFNKTDVTPYKEDELSE